MDWDILNLNEEDGWEHKQILYRLWDKNIECLTADIWFDNNVAYILGCFEPDYKIAQALNIHSDCVYAGTESGIVILNLYQEKDLRKLNK